MSKIKFLTIAFLLLSNFSFSQVEKVIPIEYYFRIVDSLEYTELKKYGILDKNDKISDEYREKETLNSKGFEKYADIKANVYLNYFKDYLLLQSLSYKDEIYALYFSIAGFDDIEFQILKYKKENSDNIDTVDKKLVYHPNTNFEKVSFNYDEGPKNIENVKIFVKNDYLVMERSGLYHSLYDLKTNKLIINEESPWHAAEESIEENDLNEWIKKNLHNKIETYLDKK